MKKYAFAIVALAVAFAAGACFHFSSASAETAPVQLPSQVWQLGVASGSSGPAAWRLNTATGYMELCSDAGGAPRCDAMPAPGAVSTTPKGLLVPAPAGR